MATQAQLTMVAVDLQEDPYSFNEQQTLLIKKTRSKEKILEKNKFAISCRHCNSRTILEIKGEYRCTNSIKEIKDRDNETYIIQYIFVILGECLNCGMPTLAQNFRCVEQVTTYNIYGSPQYKEDILEDKMDILYPSLESDYIQRSSDEASHGK